MNDLKERRRLLLLEAELHRTIIAAECGRLRGRIDRLNQTRQQLIHGKPWLFGGSALAGLFAVRHWRKALRLVPHVFTVWRLFKRRAPR